MILKAIAFDNDLASWILGDPYQNVCADRFAIDLNVRESGLNREMVMLEKA
jgi:hypothetical protein